MRKYLAISQEMSAFADSTFILDEDWKIRFDVKVDEAMNLITGILLVNKEEKVVVFSEWERMPHLIAMELKKRLMSVTSDF